MIGRNDTQVLVVGAGPVGLTLALALRRLAVDVRVVDRADDTKRQPRACVIWPRAAEALDALGVMPSFTRTSHALRSADVHVHGRRLGTLRLGRVSGAHPHPLVIEQHDIERLLAGRLREAGVEVEWGTEATRVCSADDHAAVDLVRADGGRETVRAGWVVGAEGTRSVVREQLGIPFEGSRRTDLQALQVNAVPHHWPHPYEADRGHFLLAPRTSVGVFPLPVGGYRFFAFVDDPDPSRTDPPSLAEMRELISRTAAVPDLELEPTDPLWLNRARFQDRVAAVLRRGRGLLVGDAAHAWAPIGGHGMNAGLRGAHNLAWKLAAVVHGGATDALLDTYSDEQRAAAHAIMGEMRWNALELPLSRAALAAFAAAAPVGLASDRFQQRVEFTLSDLGMHHRASPLSGAPPARRGTRLRAGDRLPDVTVALPDGERTVLHPLLGFDRWSLLLVQPPDAPDRLRAAAGAAARDAAAATGAPVRVLEVTPYGAEAERALGGDGAALLVRPDAHLGLVVPLADPATLAAHLGDYLRRWYPPLAS